MEKFSGLKMPDGEPILTQEYINTLQQQAIAKKLKNAIVPQAGGQENMLSTNVDILICGGSRGGSKSFSGLMEAQKDILNPDFHAAVFRNNKKAMEKLIRDSRKLFSQFGTYNKSQSDMTWNFNAGGTLGFYYHDDSYEDFKERFQGQEYAYIFIDEITHIEYNKFKYLTTCNRNAYGIRNRFWGTCNPDPRSWVRQFIDWWIDKDGYIDPERDGKVRYCFMKGDRINQIVWGDTREEVYLKCKEEIDEVWNPKFDEYGMTKEQMVMSVAFVRADLSQNPMLLLSDPTYLARLAQQDKGQVLRDLKANWNASEVGDDMISYDELEQVFGNAYQYGDGIRRCTADIALEGGDNLVMYLWIGYHVADFCCVNVNSKTAVSVIQHKLKEWGVLEENFCYDLQGVGQLVKGFFPEAIPFNNQAAPIADDDDDYDDGVKYLYKDLKSQCAYLTYRKLKELNISFDSSLLDRKVSGNGYEDILLRDVLQKERMSLRRDPDTKDKGFCLMPKKKSKVIVGHSPDWWESLYFRAYFDIAESVQMEVENSWMLGADMEMDFDMEFN